MNLQKRMILGLIFLILVTGCKQRETQPVTNLLLTTDQVVKVFEDNGLCFDKSTDIVANDFVLNGKKPAVFTFRQDRGQYLLIYEFSSLTRRKEAVDEFGTDYFKFRQLLADSIQKPFIYEAKNILLVYIPSGIETSPLFVSSLYRISFEQLNDIEQIVFSGEGQYWRCEMIINCYEYLLSNQDGQEQFDLYGTRRFALKYLGENTNVIESLDFDYEGLSISGTVSEIHLNEEGYVECPGASGRGVSGRSDEVVLVTVRWNNNEESFSLIKHATN